MESPSPATEWQAVPDVLDDDDLLAALLAIWQCLLGPMTKVSATALIRIRLGCTGLPC